MSNSSGKPRRSGEDSFGLHAILTEPLQPNFVLIWSFGLRASASLELVSDDIETVARISLMVDHSDRGRGLEFVVLRRTSFRKLEGTEGTIWINE